MHIDIVDDRRSWAEALAGIGEYDFAHTFDFHRLSESNGEGEPLAFVARASAGRDALAMWPVLRRPIDDTDRFDFTSVYGHAGPVLRPGIDGEQSLAAIFDAMRDYGAVSVFSRMHPLFADRLDEGSRGLRLGDIVVIDVGTDENTLGSYRGSHRREIVNARAKGVVVRVETGPSAVSDFIQLYHQAMTAVGAREFYFFGSDYIESILSAADFRSFTIFAEIDGQKISTAIFVVTGNIMQYYLSGTRADRRHLAPSKVIIAEAHQMAVRMGLKWLVLGGGVGSVPDALFAFKKGFSPVQRPFYITRRILDCEAYISLCAHRNIEPDSVSFFPAYRMPLSAS